MQGQVSSSGGADTSAVFADLLVSKLQTIHSNEITD